MSLNFPFKVMLLKVNKKKQYKYTHPLVLIK